MGFNDTSESEVEEAPRSTITSCALHVFQCDVLQVFKADLTKVAFREVQRAIAQAFPPMPLLANPFTQNRLKQARGTHFSRHSLQARAAPTSRCPDQQPVASKCDTQQGYSPSIKQSFLVLLHVTLPLVSFADSVSQGRRTGSSNRAPCPT